MAVNTATVETLTAEVRVLMVGSRQITLSVAKQLDWVKPADIDPFGRISATWEGGKLTVIGRHSHTGELVTSSTHQHHCTGVTIQALAAEMGATVLKKTRRGYEYSAPIGDGLFVTGVEAWRIEDAEKYSQEDRIAAASAILERVNTWHTLWSALPLIVLAGLR